MTTTPETPAVNRCEFRADRHTAYSDPGQWGQLLAAVPTDFPELSAVARNVIVHYRYSGAELPPTSRGDINGRWLARTLATDQQRHGAALAQPRAVERRVQGCCRDHTLFCCAVLRQHGIAARGRIGFAHYFDTEFNHDHVVVECWVADQAGSGRWARFDPEVPEPLDALATPMDMPIGPDAPFVTAAEAWRCWRAGELDAASYGAVPDSPLAGPWFIQDYVLREVAHRHGDELLLWDVWGAMAGPDEPINDQLLAMTDELAALLVQADAGDMGAEGRLRQWYQADPRLHPGGQIVRHDPFGGPAVVEDLTPTG